jgi:hypothetical protein
METLYKNQLSEAPAWFQPLVVSLHTVSIIANTLEIYRIINEKEDATTLEVYFSWVEF